MYITPTHAVPHRRPVVTNSSLADAQKTDQLTAEAARVQAAHQALDTDCREDMAVAALAMADDKSLPALGLRALLWAMLGEADQALQIDAPGTPSTSIDDLNGRYWLHYGRHVAHFNRRDWLEALMEIGVARSYAERLDDPRRAQLLTFEAQGVAVQMGCAQSGVIQHQLTQEMSEMRRAWHHADHYVTALLQEGEYRKAAEVAPATHPMHYLAHALQGHPIGDLHGADNVDLSSAQAVSDLWAGRTVEQLEGMSNDVVQTYADLAYAAWLAQDTTTAPLATEVLGSVPPLRADQAAIWAAIQLQALARGAYPDNALTLSGVLSAAVGRLRRSGDVLDFLKHIAPEGLIIAACGPHVHIDIRTATLPYLGDDQRHHIQNVKAAFMRLPQVLKPGHFPNAGVVLRGLQTMVELSVDEQQQGVERMWRLGLQLAWQSASEYVQELLTSKIDHCFLGGEEVKLMA